MVPNLLVAPTTPISEDEKLYADYPQGYYADGAYTAAPVLPSYPIKDNEIEDADPQEAYYTALHKRFSSLTNTLHSPSPAVVTSAQSFYSATHGTWRAKILYSQPTMALLSQIQQETVMRGLNVLETLLTTKNLVKGKELGAWAWGLLARCRPVGEMGSEEVGILRSLGKRAVWVLRGMVAGRDEEAMAEEDVEFDVKVELERDSVAELGEMGLDENPTGLPEDAKEGEHGEVKEPLPFAHGGSEFLRSTKADMLHKPIPTLGAFDASSMDPLEPPSTQSNPAENPSDDPLVQARHRLISSLPSSSSHTTIPATLINATIDASSSDLPPPPAALEVESPKGNKSAIENGEERDVETVIYATLDMIVTVVGEFYGQRDLLNGRVLWEEL